MRRLSRISRSNLELPDVSIVKSEPEMVCLERWWWVRTADICETESLLPVLDETPICSEIRACICRRVWPTYNAPHHWHLYLYTTCDLIAISSCNDGEFGASVAWRSSWRTTFADRLWLCLGHYVKLRQTVQVKRQATWAQKHLISTAKFL